MNRLERIGVAFDHLCSVVIGDRKLNETVSAHGGHILMRRAMGDKRPGDWRWCLLCRFLDLFQKNHCLKAAGDPNA